MKFKAWYASEDEIPDEIKSLYHKKNGRWELNISEIEDIDDLVAPGLKQKNTDLKTEKEEAKEEARVAGVAQKAAEDELAKVKRPGTVIISDADNKLFEEYKDLGPIKDIKKDLDKKKELEESENQHKSEKDIEKVADELGIDAAVVKDFLHNHKLGEGVKVSVKTKKGKSADGKKDTEEKIIQFTFDKDDNGKPKEVTMDAEDFFKEREIPKILQTSLLAKKDSNDSDNKNKTREKKFTFPRESQTKVKEDDPNSKKELEKPSDKFNQERSTRKMPWSTKE